MTSTLRFERILIDVWANGARTGSGDDWPRLAGRRSRHRRRHARVLAAACRRARVEPTSSGDAAGGALRLLPDLVRLLHRLAADREVPFGARARIVLLLIYLAIPIDLIPDFIPVLGYADDAIIVTLVLRSSVRRAGLSDVRSHWPGSDEGFMSTGKIPVTRLDITDMSATAR